MKKIALLMAVLITLTLTSCAGKKAVLNVALNQSAEALDPAKNTSADGATIILHNFEGLYTFDKNGVLTAGQAKSADISSDKLVYTFHLKDNLKWSDGKELTASDFIYSWNRALTASDYEYLFNAIKGYKDGKLDISSPDSKTLVVKLAAAFPGFLELTAQPTFAPVRKDIVEKNSDWDKKAKSYIGNGPYKLTGLSDSYAYFVKNKNYWNNKMVVSNSIKFLLKEDGTNIQKLFDSNKIVFGDIISIEDKGRSEYKQKGLLDTYFLSFNTKKAPLNNPLVREALTLAIDRNYIATSIMKSGQPAGALVPYGFSDATPAKDFRSVGGNYFELNDNMANLDKAKELLKRAGYPGGKGFPAIEYTYNEGTVHQELATALGDMWGKLGVKVELTSQDWKSFLNTRKNGDFFIARNEFIGDYNDPITFLDKFTTGNIYNDTGWSNADYDNAIKLAKAAANTADRIKLLHKAEDILIKQWTICPVYFKADEYLQSEKLQNVYISPQGYKYFMYASILKSKD